MKKILYLLLVVSLSSCAKAYQKPGRIKYYNDDFKNTEIIKLEQYFDARSAQTYHKIRTSMSLRKNIKISTSLTELSFQFDLPYLDEIEPTFFFQIDGERFEYQFNNMRNNQVQREVVDEDGATTNSHINRAKTSFSIPSSLHQKILNAKRQLFIRFYVDEVPYNINFVFFESKRSKLSFFQEFLNI